MIEKEAITSPTIGLIHWRLWKPLFRHAINDISQQTHFISILVLGEQQQVNNRMPPAKIQPVPVPVPVPVPKRREKQNIPQTTKKEVNCIERFLFVDLFVGLFVRLFVRVCLFFYRLTPPSVHPFCFIIPFPVSWFSWRSTVDFRFAFARYVVAFSFLHFVFFSFFFVLSLPFCLSVFVCFIALTEFPH